MIFKHIIYNNKLLLKYLFNILTNFIYFLILIKRLKSNDISLQLINEYLNILRDIIVLISKLNFKY